MSALQHDDLLAAASVHLLEKRLLMTRIERLTALLREHGLPLPEEDPRLGASDGQHLVACRNVVKSAYDLLSAISAFETSLDVLRAEVGSGVELLGESWRKEG